MLCQALIPTLAQARAGHSPSPLVLQLCSASGARQIVISDNGSKPSPVKSFLAAHCPYCMGAPHFALPPAETARQTPARFLDHVLVPRAAAPCIKSRKLAAAPPRGPPLAS
ncbi:hypothetical protein bgla_4p2520 (plasmid) [Burkholderia gladioli BSR3]|uniref:DUF2946 domain-containing protein n=2 Tax=Burkholderia gladioli TaxID=28095 RepID=F2LT66_BURGS|nr:hypothetical protein bgla_4p2520 [Burkholderia gladioli BSR3]